MACFNPVVGFRAARGFGRGLLVVVLLGWAVAADAQDDGVRTEVFLGAGGFLADERVVTFDVGATAWLTERWGLGAWGSFASVVGGSGGGVLLNPAVRYQLRLRRGHSIHFGVGPGYADSNVGTRAAAEWVFFPQADVLYGIQAAGNRKFGFRVGARLAGHGLRFVAVLGFTTD